MSSLVSVLYKQNLYLLQTAVSFGVYGERNNCPGVQIKSKGEIAGKKNPGILVNRKGKWSVKRTVKFWLFIC